MQTDYPQIQAALRDDDAPMAELIARYRSGHELLERTLRDLDDAHLDARPVPGKLSTLDGKLDGFERMDAASEVAIAHPPPVKPVVAEDARAMRASSLTSTGASRCSPKASSMAAARSR